MNKGLYSHSIQKHRTCILFSAFFDLYIGGIKPYALHTGKFSPQFLRTFQNVTHKTDTAEFFTS